MPVQKGRSFELKVADGQTIEVPTNGSAARKRASEAALEVEKAAIRQRLAEAAAEYEQATAGVRFSKDFWTHQEAIISDPLETYGARFMAALVRYSWGEFSLFAINEEGWPLTQQDFVRLLGASKQRISAVVSYYEARGYLYKRGKALYPVLSPTLKSPAEKSPVTRDFWEWLKVSHSATFEAVEVSRAESKRLNKVTRDLRREWRKSTQDGTNGAPILIEEIKKLDIEEDPSSSSSEVEASSPPPPEPKAEDGEETLYQEFKTQYPRKVFDEPKAKPLFLRRTKEEKHRALERLQVYLKCERWTRSPQYIPFASNWLPTCDCDPPPYKAAPNSTEAIVAGMLEYAKGRGA